MTLDGSVNIRDLESLYHIALPRDEGFETLAGFVLTQLQKIPSHRRQLRVSRPALHRMAWTACASRAVKIEAAQPQSSPATAMAH